MSSKELIAILNPEGSYELDWLTTEIPIDKGLLHFQEKLFSQYENNADKALLKLGFSNPDDAISDSLQYLRLVATTFVEKLALDPELEQLRENTTVVLEEEDLQRLLQNTPYLIGAEYLNKEWLLQRWQRLNNSFHTEIQAYKGTLKQWFAAMNPQVHPVGRVIFHLVESKKDDYPFAFLATYAAEESEAGLARHLPLKNALVEYGNNQQKLLELLSTVNRAAERSELIKELIEAGEIFHPIGLTVEEAYIFLKEVLLYEQSGIVCRIPKWWKGSSNTLKLSISVGNKPPSHLNMEALVDFDASLLLNGEAIPIDEVKKLLAEAEGLSYIKGKWVEVDHQRLNETLKAYEQAQRMVGDSEMSMIEALKFQMNAPQVLNIPKEVCDLEVTNGEWLDTVVRPLMQPEQLQSIDGGEDFHASLRAYQERGLSWLHYMKTLGLGACLADDMGLGKTVQVIALLNYIRSQHERKEKTILVVPASLIGNWMNEISKFAPSLRCCIIHPSENKQLAKLEKEKERALAEHDLFITTYGMLLKYDWIREQVWDTIILDEAQAIKNPGTKQTKAVKQLKSAYKIAMTGTPIENRLSDLWSLLDFLNKGLLGSAKEFTNFTKQMKENRDGYTRLKRAVNPFILRRLKTDNTVISDLPDKIEMKPYASLSKKQIVLYKKLVQDLKEKLDSTDEGIQRKGLVLSSLMKFKQICNHPDQYLGQTAYQEEESGKFARLREICETIYEKRERVLIFTQFKEMAEPLQAFLETVFQHKGLVLHGGTAINKRKQLVEQFQGQAYVPFMVLSIKAGGVGLNLTSANHVIHFDRWWNPAVENQATDRAFRIGQKKNVIVHKFITKGTIEEKIDQIIEEKSKLSEEIISENQESWITEMDNQQLINLLTLK